MQVEGWGFQASVFKWKRKTLPNLVFNSRSIIKNIFGTLKITSILTPYVKDSIFQKYLVFRRKSAKVRMKSVRSQNFPEVVATFFSPGQRSGSAIKVKGWAFPFLHLLFHTTKRFRKPEYGSMVLLVCEKHRERSWQEKRCLHQLQVPKWCQPSRKMGNQPGILVVFSEGLLKMKLLSNQSVDLVPSCEDCFLPAAIFMSQRSMENLQSSDGIVACWAGYFRLKEMQRVPLEERKIIIWEVVSVFPVDLSSKTVANSI